MKNFTLIFFLLLISNWGFSQINLPIDFESGSVNYADNITNFDGGQLEVIANPDVSPGNMSANVARMIKNDGQPWGGAFMALEAPIDFSTNKRANNSSVWNGLAT